MNLLWIEDIISKQSVVDHFCVYNLSAFSATEPKRKGCYIDVLFRADYSSFLLHAH